MPEGMIAFKALLFADKDFQIFCWLDKDFLSKHGLTEASLLDKPWGDELKIYCKACFTEAVGQAIPSTFAS